MRLGALILVGVVAVLAVLVGLAVRSGSSGVEPRASSSERAAPVEPLSVERGGDLGRVSVDESAHEPVSAVPRAAASGWQLVGRVETGSGEPVVGATVRVVGVRSQSASTDRRGDFALDQLGDEEVLVVVRAEGFGSVARMIASPLPGRSSTRVVITLGPGIEELVRVVDVRRSPIRDVAIWEPAKGDRVWRTDDRGLARLEGLDPSRRRWSLMVGREGYVPVDLRLDSSDSGGLTTVVLQRAATVSGVVLSDVSSVPVSKAMVVGRGADGGEVCRTHTDERGMFELSSVCPGTVEFRVTASGFAVRRWTAEVSEGGIESVTVRLVRGGELAGTLLDPDGRGVVGAAVWCYVGGERVCSGRTRSDVTGEFLVDTLSAVPTHAEVRAAGFEDARFSVASDRPTWSMEPLGRIAGAVHLA